MGGSMGGGPCQQSLEKLAGGQFFGKNSPGTLWQACSCAEGGVSPKRLHTSRNSYNYIARVGLYQCPVICVQAGLTERISWAGETWCGETVGTSEILGQPNQTGRV